MNFFNNNDIKQFVQNSKLDDDSFEVFFQALDKIRNFFTLGSRGYLGLFPEGIEFADKFFDFYISKNTQKNIDLVLNLMPRNKTILKRTTEAVLEKFPRVAMRRIREDMVVVSELDFEKRLNAIINLYNEAPDAIDFSQINRLIADQPSEFFKRIYQTHGLSDLAGRLINTIGDHYTKYFFVPYEKLVEFKNKHYISEAYLEIAKIAQSNDPLKDMSGMYRSSRLAFSVLFMNLKPSSNEEFEKIFKKVKDFAESGKLSDQETVNSLTYTLENYEMVDTITNPKILEDYSMFFTYTSAIKTGVDIDLLIPLFNKFYSNGERADPKLFEKTRVSKKDFQKIFIYLQKSDIASPPPYGMPQMTENDVKAFNKATGSRMRANSIVIQHFSIWIRFRSDELEYTYTLEMFREDMEDFEGDKSASEIIESINYIMILRNNRPEAYDERFEIYSFLED